MESDGGHHHHTKEEEEHHQPCSDEYSVSDDDGSYSDDDDDNDDRGYSNGGKSDGSIVGDFKQHLVAVLFSILAAIIAHAHVHGGGYVAWREELSRDWSAFRFRLTGADDFSSSLDGSSSPLAATAPYTVAPSMDAIPISKRQRVLERALGAMEKEDDGDSSGGGHEKARSYRRTRGLSFCPTNGSTDATPPSPDHLVEMEFILPVDPSVRVLHSYYLADALGADSGMAYGEWSKGSSSSSHGGVVGDLGSYTNDAILKDIDIVIEASDGEGLMLEQLRSIVESRLPKSLVDRQHLCLLHQYSLNKSSGRSIRGTTKVYDRPHVSTFYRRGKQEQGGAAAVEIMEPNYKVPPASLTFTGYATKFVNLSPDPLNLYWDGGRIPSGPHAGELQTVLVGTVLSMESIGTASFPGHSFYMTPTYDKNHQLQRWAITEDEPILYYDPVLGDLSTERQRVEVERLTRSGKWTEKCRFEREAWMVDRSFGRDYLVETGRVWLANFPQPYLNQYYKEIKDEIRKVEATETVQNDGHRLHMRPADYIGQVHTVNTSNLYYTDLPSKLERLAERDYRPEAEEKRRLEMSQFQSNSPNTKKKAASGDDEVNTAGMSLKAKAISVAPRVLEVKKFLSPVEVQHLISLASGIKGDVAMGRSTVSGRNVKNSGNGDGGMDASKKVRGTNGNVADARSSTGGWIHREQDAIVDTIFCRVADLLNVDEGLMRDTIPGVEEEEPSLPTHDRVVEAMQLLRYGPGEEYTAHHDFTYPSMENRYQPKRYATVLMYLTGEGDIVENGVRRRPSNGNDHVQEDGLRGGETIFPRAITTDYHDGVKVEPQSGKAILFYNVLPDGNMDDLSQHAGGKVEKGVKYMANIWIWDPIVN